MCRVDRKLAVVPVILLVVLLAAPVAWSQQQLVSAAQLHSLELDGLGSDAVYSPFGAYLAVVTRDNRVRVYDSNYDELWNYRGQDSHGTGPALAFTSDEELLIFPGYADGSQIAVVRAATGELVETLDAHEDDVKRLALSPDNRWLVSVGYGGRTIVWRREDTGFVVHQQLNREPLPALSIAFAPDSEAFALGNRDDYVELFSLDGSGEFRVSGELRPNQYYGNTGYLQGLAFSPDGRWLAAGLRDEITIWDRGAPQGTDPFIIPDIDEGYCYSLEFSPDSRLLIGGFQGSRIGVWRANDGEWRHETTFSDRQDYIWDLAVSPDGRHLASVSTTTNGVAIWELDGVEPGPLVQVARMLATAAGRAGGALGTAGVPGAAHRSILTSQMAARLIDILDPALLGPKGMFESSTTYEARLTDAAITVLRAVQDELLTRYHGRLEDNGGRVAAPLQEQGTYDIDAGRYTTRFMGTRAELAIVPREAEALYLNWQSAVIEAVANPGEAPSFDGYELVHPVGGERYPLLLGEDPLSGVRFAPEVTLARPVALTDDLVLENLRFDPLFPALYRAYERRPVGHAVLRNTGDSPAEHLTVTAILAKYSSEPAIIMTPRALAASDQVEIDLVLVLSDEIVISGGEETLSIEIAVEYEMEGEARAGQITVLVPILNRNAIRWDDDRKVGAFMTVVQSPTVMTLAGQAAADTAGAIAAALPRQLLIAMRVLELLRSQGLAYRVDPASAYADLSQSEGSIDFLQFPTETLSYGAGDCDDLSVLYNSILEAAGVRTAFITTPGHIFTAFSLGRGPDEISGIFPDQAEFIVRDDRVWVPVETTILSQGFRAAWQVGARQWRSAVANRSAGMFTTEEAWRVYPPVPWEPPSRQRESRSTAGDHFATELDGYINESLDLMIVTRGVETPQSARDYNLRGTIYARFGILDQAADEFERAVGMADYIPAILNLASVAALNGDHTAARDLLDRADGLSPDNPRILLGLAVEHLEDGRRGSARGFYDRAAVLDPRLAEAFPLFGGTGDSGGARASEGDALRAYRENAWAE
ncbi:MAG: hypothetical protein V3S41_04130 [Spirochaetia bacterium]